MITSILLGAFSSTVITVGITFAVGLSRLGPSKGSDWAAIKKAFWIAVCISLLANLIMSLLASPGWIAGSIFMVVVLIILFYKLPH